jgi:hypothetical protein
MCRIRIFVTSITVFLSKQRDKKSSRLNFKERYHVAQDCHRRHPLREHPSTQARARFRRRP